MGIPQIKSQNPIKKVQRRLVDVVDLLCWARRANVYPSIESLPNVNYLPNHRQLIEPTATALIRAATQVTGTMTLAKRSIIVPKPASTISLRVNFISLFIINEQFIEMNGLILTMKYCVFCTTRTHTLANINVVWNDAEYEKYANAEKTKADKQYTFAEKLRDALRHSDTIDTESTGDSYAVDISISGSRTDDEGIRYVSAT